MARQTNMIRDITPTTPRPWTVKVTVIEKSSPRDARSTPTKFQKLVLADSTGGVIQLTLFNSHINMFKDRLHLNKTYYISNAIVKEALHRYQFGTTIYQWSLHSGCLIDEVDEVEEIPVTHSYNFLGFNELAKYKDSASTIDVLVIVLQMLPKKQVNTKKGNLELQEFIVIDRSLVPAILTLWEPFVKDEATELASLIDQKPVLAAMRVKIIPYIGLTINSRNTSSFLINPTIPPAVELRSWLYDNMSAINNLLNCGDLIAMARIFGKEATDALTTISIVSNQLHTRPFNVKCNIELLDNQQSLMFMSCSSCHGRTTAAFQTTFTCNFCGNSGVLSVPRLSVQVQLEDSTGVLPATLIGSDAATFLGCFVDEIQQNSLLVKPQHIKNMIKSRSEGAVCLQLRVYANEFQGISTRKYIASFIDPGPVLQIEPPSTDLLPGTSNRADVDEIRTLVETNDPEMTPEEKRVLENILSRKRNRHSLQLASSSSPSATVSEIAVIQSDIGARDNSSVVTIPSIDDEGNQPYEQHVDDDAIWNQLLKGPPTSPDSKNDAASSAPKKKETSSSKAKRRLLL